MSRAEFCDNEHSASYTQWRGALYGSEGLYPTGRLFSIPRTDHGITTCGI